jgi:hypothetical protein
MLAGPLAFGWRDAALRCLRSVLERRSSSVEFLPLPAGSAGTQEEVCRATVEMLAGALQGGIECTRGRRASSAGELRMQSLEDLRGPAALHLHHKGQGKGIKIHVVIGDATLRRHGVSSL